MKNEKKLEAPEYVCFVDLDGTLCDSYHRFLHAGPEPSRKDRSDYMVWLSNVQNHESLLADDPVLPMLAMMHALQKQGWQIVFLTSREERWRDTTAKWLKDNAALPKYAPLLMRPNGDWRSSGDLKGDVIMDVMEKWRKEWPDEEPEDYFMILDDDPRGDIAEVMKQLGVVHLKPTYSEVG